jgi:hypothetical protein
VLEFERDAAAGTHHLAGTGDVYEPASELEAEAHVHVLGGNRVSSGAALNESREERRKKLLEATMMRMQREEEELENSCGTRH